MCMSASSWQISYAKNEINGFFINVAYEILKVPYEIPISKLLVYVNFNVKPDFDMV